MQVKKYTRYINTQTDRACLVIGMAEYPRTGEAVVVYIENEKLCLISYKDFENKFEEVEALI